MTSVDVGCDMHTCSTALPAFSFTVTLLIVNCGGGGGVVPQLSMHSIVVAKLTDNGDEVVFMVERLRLALTVKGEPISVTTGVRVVAVSSTELQLLCLPEICVFIRRTSFNDPVLVYPIPTM